MIDSLLDRATSILERRFPRNAFFPVFVPVLLQNDTLAESEFLPTRFENLIRAAEFYPIQRHGISLWARLKAERPSWAYGPEPADEPTVRIVTADAGPVGRAG